MIESAFISHCLYTSAHYCKFTVTKVQLFMKVRYDATLFQIILLSARLHKEEISQ